MRLKLTAFLLSGLFLASCQPKMGIDAQSETWYVSQVVDGDTLIAERQGNEEHIRLCGVDAPEADQPLGDEAAERLRELVQDQFVVLVPMERDQDDLLVAEISVLPPQGSTEPERFVQEELLKAGLVWVAPSVDDCVNGEPIKMAEAIAQQQHLGVWADAERIPLGK